ncbi:MAG TPA: class I SAM-dependent methyltransferase [Terriglobales bacterium]|nr:class I SAM-dependent methyltransferase [Terriglobales bacterium]
MNPIANLTSVHEERQPAKPTVLLTRCPACAHVIGLLDPSETTEHACGLCGFHLRNRAGVWLALAPERERYFEQFVREYEHVRTLEGRGSSSPDYYLSLPYADLTGRNAWQWSIRAISFRYLLRNILPSIESRMARPLDILDIGAGNGWLSYRLAQRGHLPVAVDLLDNDADGLGAARHYYGSLGWLFPRFQAEMDYLPFADAQFDVAIFNAALHYSEDYCSTLREAVRCLRPGGHVLIIDSPFYRSEESGYRMVDERKQQFTRAFGFASDSIGSREFLTATALAEVTASLHLHWKVRKPWYSVKWALRPVKARMLRRREPSKFYIFWAEVGG